MSAELSDDEDMSASFGTTASQADKAGSFQSGSHKNGKLKTSVPHSQLQFQDSALSPALALLPANAAEEASVADDSLFQKSDVEFLPLSASPDFSAVHESDEGSLSQHPLAQETMTSEGESALAPGDVDDAVAQAADVSHITCGSRSTQPDAASELLYRELLSQSNKSTPQMSQGGTSVPGSECDAAERSYLGFLPHSESAVKSGRLSVIPSSDENSQQVPDADPSSDVSLDSEATADSKLAASSSAVSLEVDNDAPYWTSQPTTSSKQADLNIEDRIPLYLQNLGIDQSPADILTPFAPRGPIREPEFSPTDLSTIKDSAGGTPMKSIPSSEAGSPPKVEPLDSPFGHQDPRPTVHEISGPRARSSLFAAQSASCLEKPEEGPARPGSASSSAKLTVAPPVVRNRDTDWLRRAEPEGCSTAPQSPLAVGPPPTPDDRDPASFATPAADGAAAAASSPPAGLGPLPEDPEDQASMSDGSGRSSLTVRVAKLLRDGSPAASVSDGEDPKHKKRFILELSEGRFDSLELDKEDRRRIEEIKAAMLANNFVTSESSTDTESTAASGAAAAAAMTPPSLSALASAWMPLLPEAEPAHPEAGLREIAGADVKAHTSITIAARKRPAASCPPPPPPESHPPAGISADGAPSSPEEASADTIEAEASAGPEERDDGAEEDASRQRHVAEDTTIPFGHVSRAHLTLSPKPPEPAPRPASSSSSSSSAGAPGDRFVPLRRSSPAVSSTDEGVGLSGPPPKWDERRQPTSARPAPAPPPPPPHYLHHLSVTGNAMRSYTPETPVRDECVPRASAAAPGLRPYKPRGANELFFMPHVEADASSSCTTMESSHTGLDDAVPPLFSAEVLGRQDPGLDRGVAIKHAEGIYSKRRAHAPPPPPPLLLPDRRFPHASQHKAPTTERFGAAPPDRDRLPPGLPSREAWLLEQLQRLSDLILTTGGADVPPSPMLYGVTEGAPKAWPRQAWPRQARPPCGLCPADRDESSTTTSTLDTDRLVRVFGAHRIQSAKTPKSLQKISKSSARLHKLYDHVAKQREQWEGRGFNAALSETTPTEASNVTGESSSTTGSFAKTPQHTTSKKLLSRGVQAGKQQKRIEPSPTWASDVEFVWNATRLCTRDVGTMFPPPGRARKSTAKGHVTSLKHKKTRTPPRLPKAVWWFIPLDDSSKENRPEEQEEPGEVEAAQPGPSTVWYDTAAKTARQPLRPRQQFDDDDDDDVAHPGSSASCHQITSLQEALATRRPDFISHSRQRVQILSGRKMNEALPGSGVPRRAVPRKEMKQRTKQLYEGLPEVLRKLEMERRDTQLRLNRLNLQIFNKRITKRRLENSKAVQYGNLW